MQFDPVVRAARALAGIESADRLAAVTAAVGLAQNLGALRALSDPLEPGSSALFVLVRKSTPDKVLGGFSGGLMDIDLRNDFTQHNLSSVLGIFVVLPVGLFVLALFWSWLPDKISKPFAGWYGLLAAPLIVITVYVAFDVGPFLEDTFFGGDSRAWFLEVMGLSYDQRNALVVGLIMGLAVIPVIFSIAEDAIYDGTDQRQQNDGADVRDHQQQEEEGGGMSTHGRGDP